MAQGGNDNSYSNNYSRDSVPTIARALPAKPRTAKKDSIHLPFSLVPYSRKVPQALPEPL